MKINVEIDCSPEEARTFLGLPDVQPMQKRLMDTMEKRLTDVVTAMDAKTLMDQWLPLSIKGMEQWQSLWSQMATNAAGFAKPGKSTRRD